MWGLSNEVNMLFCIRCQVYHTKLTCYFYKICAVYNDVNMLFCISEVYHMKLTCYFV